MSFFGASSTATFTLARDHWATEEHLRSVGTQNAALVADAIAATGATSPRDMGRVIKQVMEAAGGRADGKTVSTKVKEALN